MRNIWPLAIVAAGCTQEPHLEQGDITALDKGTGMIDVTACVDTGSSGCGVMHAQLIASHGSMTMMMTPSSLLFPQFWARLDEGDRDEPFVVSEGTTHATMPLPPAFELAPTPSTLRTGDKLELRWQAAGEPMVWDATYSCPSSGGWVAGENVEDDGAVEVTIERVVEWIEEGGIDAHDCTIAVELSRIREGMVDAGFRAERATGIVRRAAAVRIQR